MIAEFPLKQPKIPSTEKGKTKGISWPDFQKKYLNREDGFKYEWVNREVVKSKHMDYTQFFIINNLRDVFEQLRFLGKITGIIITEGDMQFHGNHRRPDMAYLTPTQIAHTAYGENQVPQFVVEVISNKDQMNLVYEKMQDYRNAEVQIVWLIFPKLNEVHVYSGINLKNMTVCSGSSVIPDFEMTASAIFQKPAKPV
jgi:Uma2 family endonuclease